MGGAIVRLSPANPDLSSHKWPGQCNQSGVYSCIGIEHLSYICGDSIIYQPFEMQMVDVRNVSLQPESGGIPGERRAA